MFLHSVELLLTSLKSKSKVYRHLPIKILDIDLDLWVSDLSLIPPSFKE